MKRTLGVILVWLAAITGMALAAWSTRLGPGVGGDATIYLTSAQNLVKGIGLGLVQPDGSFRLLPYSAPLFPLILSPFAAANLNLTEVARWLNILLFGGLILLIGLTSLTGLERKWWGAFPAWLIACSPILLPVYSWAMAEPITLLLGFGGLAIILKNINEEPSKSGRWVEISGLCLGLAIAARYPAAAFLAAGLLFCLFWLNAPVQKTSTGCLAHGGRRNHPNGCLGDRSIGTDVFCQFTVNIDGGGNAGAIYALLAAVEFCHVGLDFAGFCAGFAAVSNLDKRRFAGSHADHSGGCYPYGLQKLFPRHPRNAGSPACGSSPGSILASCCWST